MVVVQSVDLGLKAVVVFQPSVGPVQTAHLIYFITQVGQHATCHGATHICLSVQRVARQMHGKVALQNTYRIGIDKPLGCRFGGIYGCCIAEGDVETGFFESGAVHLNGFLVEVDAFRR